MTSMKPFLLASSALLAATTMTPAQAAPPTSAFIVAQAQGGGAAPEKKKEEEKKGPPPAAHPGPPKPPAAHPAPPRPPAAPPAPPKPPAAVQHKPPPPPAAPHPAPPHPAQTAPVHPPVPPHPAQAQPVHKPAPPQPAQVAPVHKPTPPANAQKPPAPPPVKQVAPAAQPKPQQQPPTAQQKPPSPPPHQGGPERRDHRPDEHRGPPPQPAQAAPAAAPKQAAPNAAPGQPATNKSAAPAPGGRPAAAPAATAQQPVKPRNADEFIRKGNNQPQRTMKDVRQERRTTRQDGRVFIHEGDRTIVREQNHTFIRHNDDQRFAIGARDVRVGQRNGETISVIVRPDGVTIISTSDRDGHLIRRVRRDRNGREIAIIDNRRPAPGGIFLNVRPPRIRMPRDRYIVDAYDADEEEIYDLLIAPPVEPLDGYYSLDQVRYNAAVRDYMRRLDLDINFDSGAWQITPAQMNRLSLVAEALNRAIAHNPREVFLIEGHTDAVGSEEDNLSLSDRRAETVAVALTEQFHVPPENLVTQGYGEQELKVPTQGASRANRRVAIRRITPLIDRTVRQ